MSKIRHDLIESGNILDSIYSRHLPWSGYYMVAYRATAMRQFPLLTEYWDTYCITELMAGKPDDDAAPISTIPARWPAGCTPSIAFNFGAGVQRPLGPQPIFPGQEGFHGFTNAWVWPEKLLRILESFPSRGLGKAKPVKAYVYDGDEYSAEGQWYLLPPPAAVGKPVVDKHVEELLIGYESDRREWPLLFDDTNTLDPAYDVIQYCGLSEGCIPGTEYNHNYLLLSERVVDALLQEAPWLVFHPICLASGTAFRSMPPAQERLFSLCGLSDDSGYDDLADWRWTHLADALDDDKREEGHPTLSEADAQALAALLESLRPG